jgi:hypothetical protein
MITELWNTLYIMNAKMHVGNRLLYALYHTWLPTYCVENMISTSILVYIIYSTFSTGTQKIILFCWRCVKSVLYAKFNIAFFRILNVYFLATLEEH